MKIIFLGLAVALAGLLYLSWLSDTQEPLPAHLQPEIILLTDVPIVGDVALSNPELNFNAATENPTNKRPILIKGKADIHNVMTKVTQTGADGIGGYYEANALAPEAESTQTYNDSIMGEENPDGIAPEEGSELMPSRDTIPMVSDPIGNHKGPEHD